MPSVFLIISLNPVGVDYYWNKCLNEKQYTTTSWLFLLNMYVNRKLLFPCILICCFSCSFGLFLIFVLCILLISELILFFRSLTFLENTVIIHLFGLHFVSLYAFCYVFVVSWNLELFIDFFSIIIVFCLLLSLIIVMSLFQLLNIFSQNFLYLFN